MISFLACLAAAASFSCHHSESGGLIASLDENLVSRLLRRHVENEDGQELATLSDLLLDLHSRQVKYAVLASGGFLGLGKRLKAVPWQALSAETTKKDVLALDISKPGWEQAPTLKSSSIVAIDSLVLARAIERYYDQAAKTNDAPLLPDTAPQTRATLTLTGHELEWTSHQGARQRRLESARALIGGVVINRRRQRIGRIVDLLVDFPPRRSTYAIISGDHLLKRNQRFAVALELLNLGEGHTRVVDATRTMFEQAPQFDSASRQSSRFEIAKILRFAESQSAESPIVLGQGTLPSPR
jgi:sporulation protein YlmC with PRC-barrel domain